MTFFKVKKLSNRNQYLISIALILMTAVVCFVSVEFIGYRVVALILLLEVSILAMLFDILPVVLTAVLSAVLWNYFFIPPIFNFTIGTPEDVLMFLMYFAIALINVVLTFKIRQFEKRARDKEEREKTIKLYDTLLNSLSHEMRTPLATIIGSIDTIKENSNRLTASNTVELLSEIEVASLRLNRQVENLLNMSRLEADVLKPKPDWCDLNELVFTVLKIYTDEFEGHQINFQPDEELPLFRLDVGLVEQVLHNIIHNAVLYTPKGSTVTIEIKKISGGCQIKIADNGPGFPEKDIHLAFDKFYRVPQSITGGTGLGLSIAKGFVEALNGTLTLENQIDGGAIFIITVPAEMSSIIHEVNYEQS